MSKPSSSQAALRRAEEVLDPVWDTERGNPIRTVLARRALEISPLCADAYVVLAAEAESGSEAELDLWRSGVESGELALGEDYFRECEGEFWYVLETRPYMRVRLGLALALWRRGEKEQAIDHLREMLRLNPNDNQGNRYILAAYLVEANANDEVASLLNENAEDDRAFFEWTRALVAFRLDGDSVKSRGVLARAIKSNKHIPAYLLDAVKLPKRIPDGYGLGDKNEAFFYARDCRRGWELTSGALDWLSANYRMSREEPARPGKKPKSPKH